MVFILSNNNGASWTAANNGMPTKTYIVSLAKKENKIFAGTNGSGIYLSNDSGNNWTAANVGMPSNTVVYSIVANESNVYAVTSDGIFFSSNDGQNWTLANEGLPYINAANSITLDGSNIYAGTQRYGVYKSTNNGSTWTLWSSGLPSNVNAQSVFTTQDKIFVNTELHGIWWQPRLVNNISGFTDSDFTFYPTLVKDYLTISNSSPSYHTTIKIYNLNGIEVYSSAMDKNFNEIDMTEYAIGPYFIKITQPGKGNFVRKIIKQ